MYGSSSKGANQKHQQFHHINERAGQLQSLQKNEEVSDEGEDDCGDTDEHIIHSAAAFNPSGLMSASDSGTTQSAYAMYPPTQLQSNTGDNQQMQQLQQLDEVDEQDDDEGRDYYSDEGESMKMQMHALPSDMQMVNPANQATVIKQKQQMDQQQVYQKLPAQISKTGPDGYGDSNWNVANFDDEVADEAQDDEGDDDDGEFANNSNSGHLSSGAGAQPQNFNLAYKNLVQQMLNQPQVGNNVLVPTDDYHLAEIEQPKVDLTRIQEDLERRRKRQEVREYEARVQRDAKELEGCTFAPNLMKKKKGRRVPSTPGQGTASSINLQAAVMEEEIESPEKMEGEDQRDLSRFLQDQNRYEVEKKQRKARLECQLDEEEKAMKGPKMNARSRRILERKQRGDNPDEEVEKKVTVRARVTLTSTRKTAKSVPTGSVQLNAIKDDGVGENGSSFAPRINRRSIALTAKKREGRVEDNLLRQAEVSKQKKAERVTKQAQLQSTQLHKQSDRYVLQKFAREFDKVIAYVYLPPSMDDPSMLSDADQEKNISSSRTAPINYLRFKELMIEMCFMTEAQATSDSQENNLAFELWELIAPKVLRDLISTVDVDLEDEKETAYITEIQAQEIMPTDLKVFLMAILRLNDGKLFMSASDAPLLQSENEIGFKKDGQFMLRYEELSLLQKTFDLFYTNRLQLQGQRVEQQKQLKLQIEAQKQMEDAKPQLSQKTDEFAARYRAKQIGKVRKNSLVKQTTDQPQVQDVLELDTFQWLSQQPTKASSIWQEEAKKAQDERELKECTFAPTLTARKTVMASVTENNAAPANERLYNKRKNQIEKTDKTKEEYEFEKQAEECTFAPKLSNKPARTKRQSEVAKQQSERQQKTAQKQLDRMNKAREEKERIKKLTERGIPKTAQRTGSMTSTASIAQLRQQIVSEQAGEITQTTQQSMVEKNQENTAMANRNRLSFRQTPATSGFLRNSSANKIGGVVSSSGTSGVGTGIGASGMVSAAAMKSRRSQNSSHQKSGLPLPTLSQQRLGIREMKPVSVALDEEHEEDTSEDQLVNLDVIPLQSNSEVSAIGDEQAVVLPPKQPSLNAITDPQQQLSNYQVEVSGGNLGGVNGGLNASNVTSTMFSQRHTYSMLSDETTDHHLLVHQQMHNAAEVPIIIEEIADQQQTEENDLDIEETMQVQHFNDDEELKIREDQKRMQESVNSNRQSHDAIDENDHENGMPATAITLGEDEMMTAEKSQLPDFEVGYAEEQNQQLVNMEEEDDEAEEEGGDGRENAIHMGDYEGEEGEEGENEDEDDDDYEDSNPPLLFVDVNLGANEQQRIVVYEGDTATELAEKFCQVHDLDEETQRNLEALLEQQIASVLTKIDENEEDADSYTSN